jgi:hypothetical protein
MVDNRFINVHLALLSLLGWFALIAQFYINMTSKVAPYSEIIIRYFSYFTITTNLLVSLACTILLFASASKWGRFINKQSTLTAILVYIVIVGAIYNLILRFIWQPLGLQRIVDELLHSVIPLLFLAYWFIFVYKNDLKWKDVWLWLIYPLVYLLFIFARGAFSGFYPYPFINVDQLGLLKTLVNAFYIALAFLTISFVFISIGKLTGKKM